VTLTLAVLLLVEGAYVCYCRNISGRFQPDLGIAVLVAIGLACPLFASIANGMRRPRTPIAIREVLNWGCSVILAAAFGLAVSPLPCRQAAFEFVVSVYCVFFVWAAQCAMAFLSLFVVP
jgi:uncharacterized membrane protein YqgA involved in biofilm formation